MSRLEELIRELCPDGVNYRELSEILTIKNGRDYKAFAEGSIPVYGSGGIMTYIDTAAYSKPSVLIPRKGSLDKLYYVETPFWNVDTIFYTEINENLAVPKFIFYCLQMLHLETLNKAGGVPSLTQAVLNKVKIPIPPLPVQQEIVRILDSFTALTAELQAELQARRKQYEYYRDELLNFDENHPLSKMIRELCPGGVRYVQFQDVCRYIRGITYNKTQEAKDTDDLFWKVLRANNITLSSNALNFDDIKRVKRDVKVKPDQMLKKGDILICAGSGSKEHVGKVAYITEDMEYTFGGFMAVIRCDKVLDSRFLFHILTSGEFSCYLSHALNSTTINNLNAAIMSCFRFPIPPLPVQQEIVRILDSFSSLCNDLSSGLPAEIEARQKQYEYYRDKLLTFKEVV